MIENKAEPPAGSPASASVTARRSFRAYCRLASHGSGVAVVVPALLAVGRLRVGFALQVLVLGRVGAHAAGRPLLEEVGHVSDLGKNERGGEAGYMCVCVGGGGGGEDNVYASVGLTVSTAMSAPCRRPTSTSLQWCLKSDTRV